MEISTPDDKITSDANDYSRFDNISDSDDEISNPKEESNEDEKLLPLEEAISMATMMKDKGNISFKNGDSQDARECYEKAVNVLKPHESTVFRDVTVTDGAKETTSIMSTLYSNLAMVCLKLSDYKAAVTAASKVLEKEPLNVKCLYRRGVSYFHTGSLNEARLDLLKTIDLDPENIAAKKELALVSKAQKDLKDKEKKAFGSLFTKNIYADREQEHEAKLQKIEDEKQKERDDYTKSKMERRARGEDEQTFEEWKKEQDDFKKVNSSDVKPLKNESSTPKVSSAVSPKVNQKKLSDNDSEDDQYDEEDKKIIQEATKKGYCYFRNEQTKEQRELIGDIAPKALSENADSSAKIVRSLSEDTVTASSWNAAGTWEEKDLTSFGKEKLQEIFTSAEFCSEGNKVVVTSAKAVEGDAQIVLTRGKKRYIYDFNVSLDVEWHVTDAEKTKKIKGTLIFPEISPLSSYESIVSYKKEIPSGLVSIVNDLTSNFKSKIIEKLKGFDTEFKSL